MQAKQDNKNSSELAKANHSNELQGTSAKKDAEIQELQSKLSNKEVAQKHAPDVWESLTLDVQEELALAISERAPQYLAAIHHLSQRVRRAGQILKNIMWMLSLPRPRLRLRSSASADLCALGRPCHPVLILGLPLPACVASSNCLDLLLSLFCNVPLCTRDQPQNK